MEALIEMWGKHDILLGAQFPTNTEEQAPSSSIRSHSLWRKLLGGGGACRDNKLLICEVPSICTPCYWTYFLQLHIYSYDQYMCIIINLSNSLDIWSIIQPISEKASLRTGSFDEVIEKLSTR